MHDSEELGFDSKTVEFVTNGLQSKDIAQGVDKQNDEEQGVGSGPRLVMQIRNRRINAAITFLRLVQKLAELRKGKDVSWLRPDAKSQVTFKYDKDKVQLKIL